MGPHQPRKPQSKALHTFDATEFDLEWLDAAGVGSEGAMCPLVVVGSGRHAVADMRRSGVSATNVVSFLCGWANGRELIATCDPLHAARAHVGLTGLETTIAAAMHIAC